ncbi:MAG: T9SS type A sorting domain-containing protein, partial [Flavobacteriales bacterium]|nr:T9SS type A sorting domain-containing protein [Flavobacteriales bacterium]
TVSTEVIDDLSTTGSLQAGSIKLSPNPAADQVRIINNSNAEIQNIELYSTSGKWVRNFTRFETLDISTINSGMYLLRIETDSSTVNKRLIIK